MKTLWSRAALVLTVAVTLAVASPTHAGLVVTFQESGTNVVATLSGSFASLPTVDATGDAFLGNQFRNNQPYFGSTNLAPAGSTVVVSLNDYDWFGGNFPAFGTSATLRNATAIAGLTTSFSINAISLAMPSSYTPGTSFTGTLTWAGQSFTSLSLTQGSYVRSLRNAQTVTINVSAVPEPSTCAMALAGLACGGYSVWRRRTRG